MNNEPKILHPCDEWAINAGVSSWSEAKTRINNGSILVGSINKNMKSNMAINLFREEVLKAGLSCKVDDFGRIAVGNLNEINDKDKKDTYGN